MRIKFKKNLSCVSPEQCTDKILNQLEIKLKCNLHYTQGDPFPQGHLSIHHVNGEHVIFLFLYDKDGIHESEDTLTKKIIFKSNPKVKSYSGPLPNQKEIEQTIV